MNYTCKKGRIRQNPCHYKKNIPIQHSCHRHHHQHHHHQHYLKLLWSSRKITLYGDQLTYNIINYWRSICSSFFFSFIVWFHLFFFITPSSVSTSSNITKLNDSAAGKRVTEMPMAVNFHKQEKQTSLGNKIKKIDPHAIPHIYQ